MHYHAMEQLLRSFGCERVRASGSHEMYQHRTTGVRFPVIRRHDYGAPLIAKIRKQALQAGQHLPIDDGGEPGYPANSPSSLDGSE